MKKMYKKSLTPGILGIILCSTLLQSCSTFNRIYSEDDIVFSSKRFELKYYVKDRDRRSPLVYFTQSIVKEINSSNEVSYSVYDVLYLTESSFKLDEKALLIIDNGAYPMAIDKIEFENVKSISENTTDVPTSDSTSVSVITGYSENNRKLTRFVYEIPVSVIGRIKEADQFSMRYYAGPSMITVKPKKRSIKKVKELIDKT